MQVKLLRSTSSARQDKNRTSTVSNNRRECELVRCSSSICAVARLHAAKSATSSILPSLARLPRGIRIWCVRFATNCPWCESKCQPFTSATILFALQDARVSAYDICAAIVRTPRTSSLAQYRATSRTENAHEEGIWSVKWTDADQILSGSVDERARLW